MFARPLQIAALMSNFKPRWLIAGGWAIDLFFGKETRPHQDIEIAVLRRDQTIIRDYFDGWQFRKIAGGKKEVWQRGEWLALPVHEIHCLNELMPPTQIEILLNESNETEWIYRRNDKVRRPLDKIQLERGAGVKFLCPEIVLLYKSKLPRAKDERDFLAVVERLDAERKKWLKDAIEVCDSKHPWLQSL